MSGSARARAWLVALVVTVAACGGGVGSPSPEKRAAAVRALASEAGDAPAPALLVAQRDASPLVRRAAAEALAERRGPHAAEALGAMLPDEDAGVARAAAFGLARLGDLDAARTALTEGYALASPAGRLAIYDALTEIGVSLRDAVEAEARRLWARNLAVLSSGSQEARAGAAEELGASGRTEAVLRLREVIARPDEDRRVVAAALRGLGEAGDLAVRPLLEQALNRGELEVALAAAHALGRLGDPAATPPLARLAAAGSGPLNLAAFEALDSLPTAPEVSQALCGVAQRSSTPWLAARAARSAWARNADCPASALSVRAGRGDAAALAAVAELHPETSVMGPLATRLLAELADARGSAERRRRASTALGALEWEAAGPAIEARARALSTRLAGRRTQWIPGHFAGSAELPSSDGARFAQLLTRDGTVPPRSPGQCKETPEWIDVTAVADAEELQALLATLGRLRVSSARDLLVAAAADPVASIRAGAVEGLGYLGGEEPPSELAAALSDPSEAVRTAALTVLPRFGPAALPVLEPAVARAGGGDERTAAALARALGDTGSPKALPSLAILLAGPAPAAAATAVAAIGDAEGATALVAHLGTPSSMGKVEALDALAQLAAKGAGEAIESSLLSERPEVRAAAARAIGRLRYEPASSRLEALRVDYDGRVRRATIEALAKLPSGRPGAR